MTPAEKLERSRKDRARYQRNIDRQRARARDYKRYSTMQRAIAAGRRDVANLLGVSQ